MRRPRRRTGTGCRAIATLLVLATTGCATADVGPSRPLALEQVLPVKALDVAAVRLATRSFIEAYAASGADGATGVRRLVVGRELTRWARWLGIQNAQFEGAVRGRAEISEVRLLGVALGDTYDVARVRVHATVTFTYTPDDGEPFTLGRVLDGPMLLARVGQEDWAVADLTRDGAQLSAGVRELTGTRVTAGGVTVALDSAFVFPVGIQVNVVVENRTSAEIRLGSVTMRTASGTADGHATKPLRAVPPGAGAIGILAFGPLDDTAGATLELRYRTATGTTTLAVALDDLLGSGSASATPSPSA